jgi:hypothetical protein
MQSASAHKAPRPLPGSFQWQQGDFFFTPKISLKYPS